MPFQLEGLGSEDVRSGRKQIVDGRCVARRCCGHHRVVCSARFGVRGYDKQEDPVAAVGAQHLEGAYWLSLVPVESNRSPPGRQSPRHLCPLGEVVHHAINRAEAHRQHRQQIRQLTSEVVAAWPPCPVNVARRRRLGLQSQSRGVLVSRVVIGLSVLTAKTAEFRTTPRVGAHLARDLARQRFLL